jgi:uncharacterized protein (DUF1501 family)
MPQPTTQPHLPSRRGILRNLVFGQPPTVANPGARTLVCVFLRGGADTLNMIVPWGDDRYYRKRPTLAIPAPASGTSGASIRLDEFYAFHPGMSGLLPIYKDGRLGIVQAVGTDNSSGSHFEAQDQMEHGDSHLQTSGGGWLGRHLRSRVGRGDSPLSGVAIGATIPESLRGAAAASAFRTVEEIQVPAIGGDPQAVSRALSALYGSEVGILGEQGRETLRLLRKVQTLRSETYVTESGVEYADVPFARGLREIARLVKADLGLEAACIDLDGWDTHFFQGTTGGLQAGLIQRLSDGLAAFDADLRRYRDRVTTVVMTEFGRRLYENGSIGTDHGRGFAMLAMGHGINGGRVHGEWPGLDETLNPVGPGGMDVRIDYRSVLSEILINSIGSPETRSVFPNFTPSPVGIAG